MRDVALMPATVKPAVTDKKTPKSGPKSGA
jgi:hypothetical protein